MPVNTVGGFPFIEIVFDKSGALQNRQDVDALIAFLNSERQNGTPVTDLLLMSHGWMTDEVGATELYTGLLTIARKLIDTNRFPGIAGKHIAVLGVVWPSKAFGAQTQSTTGNAASFGSDENENQQGVAADLDRLMETVDDPARAALLQQAKGLLDSLADNPPSQDRFVDLIRSVVLSESQPTARLAKASPTSIPDDNETSFQTKPGRDIFGQLSKPILVDPTPASTDDSGGGAALSMDSDSTDGDATTSDSSDGSAAGFNLFGGIMGAAQNFLNLTTFYLMKARSGTVGLNGVYPTLKEIVSGNPTLNIHLFGHSFGARLVTSVAQGPQGSSPLPIRSMMLAQGAFSHGGFSDNFDGNNHPGGFRTVITGKRITGPIVATHSVHDFPVGRVYPMAVRLDRDDASGFGGPDDLYGGIGFNGAQKTPEAIFQTMQDLGGSYTFASDSIYNLKSDAYISSHTDIVRDQVLYALLSAIQAGSASTPPTVVPPVAPLGAPPTPATPQPATTTNTPASNNTPSSMPPSAPSATPSATQAVLPTNAPASETLLQPSVQPSIQPSVQLEGGQVKPNFDQSMLDTSVIALPLLKLLEPEKTTVNRICNLLQQKSRARTDSQIAPLTPDEEAELQANRKSYDVIIDVNLNHTGPAIDLMDQGNQASSRNLAKERIYALMGDVLSDLKGAPQSREGLPIAWTKTKLDSQYVFATLEGAAICELVRRDRETPLPSVSPPSGQQPARALSGHRAIYRVWNDFEVKALLTQSISTVKANAAHVSFGALGRGIVWAVMDSGIDERHQHFKTFQTLNPPLPIRHIDFSGAEPCSNNSTTNSPTNSTNSNANDTSENSTAASASQNPALCDNFGHGTHVAGIIAGALKKVKNSEAQNYEEKNKEEKNKEEKNKEEKNKEETITAIARHRDESGTVTYEPIEITAISGIAPECKLVSLRVLNDKGEGKCSNIIAAINYVQEVNGNGRRIQIHGVNLSVGYDFDPEWFACGQSPLCVEVDRLVRSGVVVVVAAGNTGYGFDNVKNKGAVAAGLALSINDPGNAELAITVGSTHRDMPHIYGVSYFSSKGPTGDGRDKPDLVAPGEKILSCAAGGIGAEAVHKFQVNAANQQAPTAAGNAPAPPVLTDVDLTCAYVEQSGTSMAAPHVSGAIAAFLSIRQEYVGRPEEVKEIFCNTATDLKRMRHFQGNGLVDLMRAIQSV